jgi:hypothetical protein
MRDVTAGSLSLECLWHRRKRRQLEVLPGGGHFHDTGLWRAVFQAAQTSTNPVNADE